MAILGILKNDLEKSYVSFESPIRELLESGEILVMTSSWRWPRSPDKKLSLLQKLVGASLDRDIHNFKTFFRSHILGLFKKVYNSFLAQLAQKWWIVKFWSVKKKWNLLNKTDVFWLFKFSQTDIFEPVKLERSYVSCLKTLKYEL